MDTQHSPASDQLAALPLSFSGTLWRYWGIHYLGLLLSILTLGLYSPWAKLRRHRYLLGNTQLMGSNFEFDASPWSILISRIIVVALLVLAAVADDYVPLTFALDLDLGLGLGSVVLAILLPLAMVRGRAFHARHTLLRGVRFRYAGGYLPLAVNFALFYAPLLALPLVFLQAVQDIEAPDLGIWEEVLGQYRYWALDLGLWEEVLGQYVYWMGGLVIYLLIVWPGIIAWRHRILLNHLSFGNLRLRSTARVPTYYAAFLLIFAVFAALLYAYLEFSLRLHLSGGVPVLLYLLWLGYDLLVKKIFWSSIVLSDGSRIASGVTLRGLFRVAMANLLTIVLSFGLLLPVAKARNWRYIATHVAIVPGSKLGSVAAGQDEAVNALGEEGIDMIGFDFDAGVI